MYAFTFWQDYGGRPAYIILALETQQKNLSLGFEHVHLDMQTVRDWCPHVERYWQAATPQSDGRTISMKARQTAQFTGILRVYLIAKYGGVWIDADTFVFPNFSALTHPIGTHDLFCSERENQNLANCIMGARSNSLFMAELLEKVEEKIDEKKVKQEKARWGEFGFKLMKNHYLQSPIEGAFVMPLGLLLSRDEIIGDAIFSATQTTIPPVSDMAFAISFFNNGISTRYRDLTRDELLKKSPILATLYERAMNGSAYTEIVNAENFDQIIGPLNRASMVWEYHKARLAAQEARDKVQRIRNKFRKIKKK
jgi:hypothetical protein